MYESGNKNVSIWSLPERPSQRSSHRWWPACLTVSKAGVVVPRVVVRVAVVGVVLEDVVVVVPGHAAGAFVDDHRTVGVVVVVELVVVVDGVGMAAKLPFADGERWGNRGRREEEEDGGRRLVVGGRGAVIKGKVSRLIQFGKEESDNK